MARLDQILASLGYGSRRDAKAMLAGRRVTVAGQVVTDPGAKAAAREVLLDGQPLEFPDGVYVLFHKPAGLACSHDPREAPLIYSALPARWLARNPVVSSVGRLDRDTTGLLLLSDDTQWQHRLTSPKHRVEKVYVAELDVAPPLDGLAEVFAAGTLMIAGEDKPCAPARLRWRGPRTAELGLVEGRYHQVKRMFAHFGSQVVKLHRESLGGLTLGDLAPGQWRELTPSERAGLEG